jgi:arylsulfatase A-like enzyme/Tfp pilus assembly protein PilF
MRRRIVRLAALVLLAAACNRQGAVDPKAPIILISIDTLRSDHLPAYGYSKVDTPALDSLRKDSILFERAYSHTPLTLVSHASVFTGQLPADHGIRDNLGYELNKTSTSFVDLLKAKGYATGGAVSAVVLRGETGIKRGFDFWNDDIDLDATALSIGRSQRPGDATREIAEKWIGEHKAQPFFFFLHLYEPHTPYDAPEPFKSKYALPYDADIANADAVVGRFLDYLRAEGIYDKATIILMSDHGEGLGQHGEEEHGIFLYREDIQVPLFLKLPKEAQKGSSVAAPVQLIDIYPTIAQALGNNAEKREGRSLLDVANGKIKDERTIYSETYYPRIHFGWNDVHSLVAGANHYIQAPKPELYDIVADPAESKNVLLDNRRAYVALRERIQPYIHSAAAPAAVDDEQKQQLTALGYLGSTIASKPDEVLPDAKDNISKANEIGHAFTSFRDGHYDETDRITAKLLKENPNMLDIWSMRARALQKLNRPAEAIAAAKEGLRLQPTSSNLAMTVANLSLDTGQYDDAEKHARLLMKETPTEAHHLLAELAMAKKDYPKARQEAALALGEKRNRPASLVLLGRIAQAEGKMDEALKDFDEAQALLDKGKRTPIPKLNYFRGDTLARMGRGEEAEQAFLAEIRLFPTDPQAYKNLILLYATLGKTQEATQLIFALEKASPTPPSYAAISETLKIIGDRNGAHFWAARGLSRFPADRQLQTLTRG